jgi:hypothetical protein
MTQNKNPLKNADLAARPVFVCVIVLLFAPQTALFSKNLNSFLPAKYGN